jgi:hypothetical protein
MDSTGGDGILASQWLSCICSICESAQHSHLSSVECPNGGMHYAKVSAYHRDVELLACEYSAKHLRGGDAQK